MKNLSIVDCHHVSGGLDKTDLMPLLELIQIYTKKGILPCVNQDVLNFLNDNGKTLMAAGALMVLIAGSLDCAKICPREAA